MRSVVSAGALSKIPPLDRLRSLRNWMRRFGCQFCLAHRIENTQRFTFAGQGFKFCPLRRFMFDNVSLGCVEIIFCGVEIFYGFARDASGVAIPSVSADFCVSG